MWFEAGRLWQICLDKDGLSCFRSADCQNLHGHSPTAGPFVYEKQQNAAYSARLLETLEILNGSQLFTYFYPQLTHAVFRSSMFPAVADPDSGPDQEFTMRPKRRWNERTRLILTLH